jgi:hypothetical protein
MENSESRCRIEQFVAGFIKFDALEINQPSQRGATVCRHGKDEFPHHPITKQRHGIWMSGLPAKSRV